MRALSDPQRLGGRWVWGDIFKEIYSDLEHLPVLLATGEPTGCKDQEEGRNYTLRLPVPLQSTPEKKNHAL